jgi:hypothetical protein
MQINEITTIIKVISILIMTSVTGSSSSLVFAQNESETDLDSLTFTNSSEVLVDVTSTNSSEVQGNNSGVTQQPQALNGTWTPPGVEQTS